MYSGIALKQNSKIGKSHISGEMGDFLGIRI